MKSIDKSKSAGNTLTASDLAPFVLISIFHLYAEWHGLTSWQHFTKPLLMPALAWIVWQHRKSVSRPLKPLLVAALFFSWLGDSLLMYQNLKQIYFIAGLIAFLIAHVCYTVLFLALQHKSNLSLWCKGLLTFCGLLLVGYGWSIFRLLIPGLESMKIPVAVYATIITIMCLSAISRYSRTNFSSFILTLVGALLFLLSDTLLAVNKFHHSIEYAGLWIMLTYLTAQLLLVNGIMIHTNTSISSHMKPDDQTD